MSTLEIKFLLAVGLWLAILGIRHVLFRKDSARKQKEDDEIHWL